MEDENLLVDDSEAISEEEEQELEILDDEEGIEDVQARAEKATRFAKQAIARAKKAEAENKELKKSSEVKADVPPITSNLTEETIERKILKNDGLSDELIDELTALAKVRGTSLLDTQKDPIYLAIKEAKEKEEQEAKAKLPAAKGSRTQKSKKDFNSQDLSEADHKAMWRDSQK